MDLLTPQAERPGSLLKVPETLVGESGWRWVGARQEGVGPGGKEGAESK